MRHAIKEKAPQEILRSLLEAHVSHCLLVRSEYDAWLASAIRTGSVETVKFVLDIRLRSKAKVTRGRLITACTHGVPEVVTALFGRNLMNSNRKFSNTTPLIAAVRSRHLDVVKAVLSAGADISGSIEQYPHTPLRAAFSMKTRKDAVTELLVAHGAIIPDSEPWPRKANLWNALRKARMAQGGSSVPTFGEHREAIVKQRMKANAEKRKRNRSNDSPGIDAH